MNKCTQCDKLNNALDMQRDEFKRIIALLDKPTNQHDAEIIGICNRAISSIEQAVPLIVQRDNLQVRNWKLSNLLEGCEHALRSYQYGNNSPELAEEMANKVSGILS